MFPYTLGLDIGISSIGWAVLRTDIMGEPDKIENLGVRIFEKAEHPKTGASLALPRREARGARRRIRRRRHRKERIKTLFEQAGLMSKVEMDRLFQLSGYAQDVYALRAEGLERNLTLDEWIRVLIHLSQRRGYRTNSAAEESKNMETSVLKTALSANACLMAEKGYRTAGEMFANDPKFTLINPDGSVWRKTRNSAGEYHFTVTREMVEQEVTVLFAAQRTYGNLFASEELEEAYSEILFSQRNFDVGPGGDSPYRKNDLRGKCTFERNELRAFKACYTFEYFKLLQDLNHIRILANDAPSRPLTASERECLISLAMKSDNLHYGRLRKELALPDGFRFNTVRYAEKRMDVAEKKMEFAEMQSYHKLRKALDSIQNGLITSFSHDQLDEIATILSLYKSDERRRTALAEVGLDASAIECLLPLSFSKVGHLSLCAMKKLIPHLEQGHNYSTACATVYGDNRVHGDIKKSQTLSFNILRDQGALDKISNPVVLRTISQTCKVINAIVRKYGPPETVHFELAREMSRNFADRTKMAKQHQETQAANERLMEQIEEIKGNRPTGQDLVKFKLFKEQNEICLYSGQKLDVSRLFEPGYVDVDHIIPYSISFDDNNRNKALVLTSENRQKGNRLPMEYMAGNDAKIERFTALTETCVHDYRKRQKLLKKELTKKELETLKTRNLVDTQYIARSIYNILNDYLEFAPSDREKKVTAINGAVTDYIRKRLGLRKIYEDGDLHHASDAVIVAIATDGMIQRISNFSKRRELGHTVMEKHVNPETGELMAQVDFDEKYVFEFPQPWPWFCKELNARLSPKPYLEIMYLNLPTYETNVEIDSVFVSRTPNRKVTGAAHKETTRSAKMHGYSVIKTPLTALKLDSDGEIKDYYNPDSDRLLYEALQARLKQFGGDGKKAFTVPFHKPKRDGTPGPLVNKVKTYAKTNLNVPVNGGIADNGRMVRIDIFYVKDDGYYFVPIYTSDTVKEELPNRAVVAYVSKEKWKPMHDDDFQFSLYHGDLIQVKSSRNINLTAVSKSSAYEQKLCCRECMMYFTGANIFTGAINGTTHDRKYNKDGLGIKTLCSIRKYEVDVLGKYHEIRLPETRRTYNS